MQGGRLFCYLNAPSSNNIKSRWIFKTMKYTTILISLAVLSLHISCIHGWFFESPEHPTRREDELTDIAEVNPEDLDDMQLFLTYKPYFLEYARQQMLRKRNPPSKRSLPIMLRQRKEK
ncbi:uncharacterized protein LOC134699105 [Mytilus trossulus]